MSMGKVSSLSICVIILLTAIITVGAISIHSPRKLDIQETGLWDIALSPDGAKIAYVAYDNARNQQIFVINADGTGKKKITDDRYKKWGLAWGPDKIAYVSFGSDGLEKIFVINPDGTDRKQLILDNTRQGKSRDDEPPVWGPPSWSHDGRFLVYTSLDEKANPKLYLVNSDGTGKKQIYKDNFKQWSPSVSPDGRNIVYVSYNDRFREELFIVDINGTSRRQLTFDEIKKNYPVWGPEGTIVFVSYENRTSSTEKIFAIDQDGKNRRLLLGNTDLKQRSPTFSMDGSRFAYAAIDYSGDVRIAVADISAPAAAPEITEVQVTPPEPAATSPVEEVPEISEGNGYVLWGVIIVLAIIVILLLARLAISDFFSRKK
jgi:TolB protein